MLCSGCGSRLYLRRRPTSKLEDVIVFGLLLAVSALFFLEQDSSLGWTAWTLYMVFTSVYSHAVLSLMGGKIDIVRNDGASGPHSLLSIIFRLLSVTAVLFLIYLLVAGRDIPVPDTSDIALHRVAVSDEKNACTYFSAAVNALYLPEDISVVKRYIEEDKAVDGNAVRLIIDKNYETYQFVERGIALDVFQRPEINDLVDNFPNTEKWRYAGKVLALKCKYERQSGNYAKATDTCIALLKFGNTIQRDADCLVGYLVGVGNINQGIQQARHLAYEPGMTESDLTKLSEVLAGIGTLDKGLIRAIKGEYKLVVRHIDGFGAIESDSDVSARGDRSFSSRKLPGYLFMPNRTKLLLADYHRSIIKKVPCSFADMDLDDSNEVPCSRGKWFSPNMVGRGLVDMGLYPFGDCLELKCQNEAVLAAIRLIMACKVYEQRNKELPASLDMLVPEYISAIPRDPYDGAPFRYSRSDAIVYSVGKDLRDNGGSRRIPAGERSDTYYAKLWNAADAVFSIEHRDM